uniref:Permease n=2 Tax=Paenibacillus athensensis TaxID=1967502 RepID=A0A4Y8PZ19_9BACL
MQIFKTMLISIVLEALPFILLGVVISALLQVFVSDRTIRRLIPTHPLLGMLVACVIGIIFPICECGMVPVIRKLIKKGMPLYVAVVFILVGPILNPIVFLSTYMAFRGRPEVTFGRMGLAVAAALAVGWLVYRVVRGGQLKEDGEETLRQAASGGSKPAHRKVRVARSAAVQVRPAERAVVRPVGRQDSRWMEFVQHATGEFFEMGKYLMLGSIIAAGVQTLIARESLVALGHGPLGSNLLMMALAYLLSLCSTSDAFVAASFTGTFHAGSLVAFLVFGPMLNLKGTLMLLAVFKKKFVLLLSGGVVATVLTGSLLLGALLSR